MYNGQIKDKEIISLSILGKIMMYIKQMGVNVINQIELAQDRDHWRN